MRLSDATPRINKVTRIPIGPDEWRKGTATDVNSDRMNDTMYNAKIPIVRLMIVAWKAGVALMIFADHRKYITPIMQTVPRPACKTIPECWPSYTKDTPPTNMPWKRAYMMAPGAGFLGLVKIITRAVSNPPTKPIAVMRKRAP